MKRTAALIVLIISPAALAQSLFNGTWRPDPQRADPDRQPDVIHLAHGEYECSSCKPPYKVRADGTDQPVAGNPRFDTIQIEVVDERTIAKVAKKGGATVVESTAQVSSDGRELTERQILSDVGPRKVDFTSRSTRVAPQPDGSHRVSGSWRLLEADLTHHDEDTTYVVADGKLSMSDLMGRSFTARLDGSDAPYEGDPEITSVSLKLIDERTIEESDKKDGKVVKVSRWSIDPDGKTIHARFDDTHGHLQHQSGHRIAN